MPQLFTANVLKDIYQTEEGERRYKLEEERLRQNALRMDRQETRADTTNAMAGERLQIEKDRFNREGLDIDRKTLKAGIDFLADTVTKVTPGNYEANFLPLIKATVGDDTFKGLRLPDKYDKGAIDNLAGLVSGLSADADKGLVSEKVMRQRLREYEDKLKIKSKYDKKDKDAKPDLTEAQARAKLIDVAKYRQKLNASGGLDEALFAIIAKDAPELAEMLKGADKTEINVKLAEYETYLKGFTKKDQKRLKYIPGKGFVEVE